MTLYEKKLTSFRSSLSRTKTVERIRKRREYQRARWKAKGHFLNSQDRGYFYWETSPDPVFQMELESALRYARGPSAVSL